MSHQVMHCVLLISLTLWQTFIVSGKIIDLSHKHGPTTFMVPGFNHYKRSNVTVTNRGNVRIEAGDYSSAEHGGTHLDAPVHFSENGVALDDLPIENTIADGVMIDVADEASRNIEYKVPLSKVQEWERKNGDIPQEAAVIFNFGWHKRFHDKKLYVNTESNDWKDLKFPSVSEEVGMYLYEKRNIKIIGTDTMSPDPPNSGNPIHVRYLPNNKLIVENLNATDLLPPKNFRFHAAPVRYVGASGAQVRAYAIIYETQRSGSNAIYLKWSLVLISAFIRVF
ncbi:kynurenine formamidase-like [Biomphalaria glabrata]|uniref:Kynurenine formamidase-like n=1 Tax=Biomphalaria glabrata TaxID=6526 RepID=A0A2C9L8N6_BIOGL|nr:kynurenine formamidase-like [Biomphalaria glabrata]XP_055883323.1 kynurenine formamidase-like [Biomphalaria glabrata]